MTQARYRGYRSTLDILDEAVERHPDQPAYRRKVDGRWQDRSWRETRADIAQIGRSLIALGVGPSEKVSILAQTRLEWVELDFAIMAAGGTTVGIYPSSLPADCAYVLNHSEAMVLFVEDQAQLEKIEQVRSDLHDLRTIVMIDGNPAADGEALSWQQFLDLGAEVDPARLEERIAALTPDGLASLVYTSGTTGVPKGVMISHRNLIFVGWSTPQALQIDSGAVCMLFLPLAHVFARLIIHCCMKNGATIGFVGDLGKIPETLKEMQPHWFPSVPRIYEKFYDKIRAGAVAAGGFRQQIFDWAIARGLEASRLRQQRKPIPTLLAIQLRVADRLVYGKIRAAFGGRLRFAVSGAAPLNQSIAEFFDACGVLILEGIGMTENTSFSHVNRLEDNRFGTVGQPGPGIEVKIAEDGEVLFRGDNVMVGYYKNVEATAEAIDPDGWLHSGDIGEIDDRGFLTITDRKKDLIVTAGGKNVAPQRVERLLRTSRFISHAMAYGDRRKYLTALITLDSETVGEWLVTKGRNGGPHHELSRDPAVLELIGSQIEACNRQLASFETVKKFKILDEDFSIEEGDLTPTLKLKRKVIIEKHQAALDSLY